MDAAAFKRSIRDLQVWCSSCMVAFSGSDPIGVLIGAKRQPATLIHKIAVHPDHTRQGHGRHLLDSLSSKLAILGPPRIVAEVPEAFAPARALFRGAGYDEEAVLTDYVLEARDASDEPAGGYVIPVTVDDFAANDLLEGPQQVCWKQAIETLTARKDTIEGLAVASEDRIDACILYIKDEAEIVALRSLVPGGEAALRRLLFRLQARCPEALRFPKVHPSGFPDRFLESLGLRPAGRHVLFSATPRSA